MNMNRSLKKLSSALLVFALLGSWMLSAATVARAGDNGGADASPTRLMNWEATGPLGGDVRSLAIDPKDARRLYFGTIDGQIYTSTDGGETWTRLEGFNRPGLLISNLLINPRAP